LRAAVTCRYRKTEDSKLAQAAQNVLRHVLIGSVNVGGPRPNLATSKVAECLPQQARLRARAHVLERTVAAGDALQEWRLVYFFSRGTTGDRTRGIRQRSV